MFVLVRLLKGYPKPLFYQVPAQEDLGNLVGKIIQVPLKNKNLPALVVKTYKVLPEKFNFQIKQITQIQKFPEDKLYYTFLEKISKFYFLDPFYFYQRIRNFLFESKSNKQRKTSNFFQEAKKRDEVLLNQEQQNVLIGITSVIQANVFTPIVLCGVTGSGKTEIYKRLIIQTIQKGQTVIFLLPEVGLSLQFQHLLQQQLPQEFAVIGFHSATTQSEKKALWDRLLEGKPVLILGVHLPILLPIKNLGLIIVDEEHETGFQEKKHPKVNSKEIALWRAKEYQVPIILGSATPSLSSLHNIQTKQWNFFQLKQRFSGAFPKIELVFLNEKTAKRRRSFWISDQLEKAIKERLLKKEQAIIYINRRGYSFFVQCKSCGFIFECKNCSVSMTLHNDSNQDLLRCHYCDYQKLLPESCPQCKAASKEFLTKGIGTQQVVQLLQNIFPDAKIERADLDSTVKKKQWQKTLEGFKNGEIDILVGTQTITKGYHFPKVTLVGILWADLNLHFPIFNSAETTLQKIIQVAGRAGRQSQNSLVIVQTMQDHYIFNYLNEQNYLDFCTQEMEFREQTKYPPFGRLIQIELKNSDVKALEKDSVNIVNFLRQINEAQNLGIQILGPSKPVIHKIKRTEARQIFLKTDSFAKAHELLQNIDFGKFKSSIFIVPTP
jgi:primosomal protein N' (replication factor Y) (superfamily II helicase)